LVLHKQAYRYKGRNAAREFTLAIRSFVPSLFLLPTLVVVETLLFFPFQVLKSRCFYVDLKIVTLSLSERNPIETHFPAVQISV